MAMELSSNILARGGIPVGQKTQNERELEEKKVKFDLYKTLVNSGYSSKDAFNATLQGTGVPMPKEKGVDLDTQEQILDISLKKQELERGPKKTEGEKWSDKVNSWRRGETTEEELRKSEPSESKQAEIDKLKERDRKQQMKREIMASPLLKKPIDKISKLKDFFYLGKGARAMNDTTAQIFKHIDSYEKLLNIIKQKDKLERAGVDVDLILEHYNEELVEMAENGVDVPGIDIEEE